MGSGVRWGLALSPLLFNSCMIEEFVREAEEDLKENMKVVGKWIKALRFTYGQMMIARSQWGISCFEVRTFNWKHTHSFIHTEHLYSASSRELLRGAPDSSTAKKSCTYCIWHLVQMIRTRKIKSDLLQPLFACWNDIQFDAWLKVLSSCCGYWLLYMILYCICLPVCARTHVYGCGCVRVSVCGVWLALLIVWLTKWWVVLLNWGFD